MQNLISSFLTKEIDENKSKIREIATIDLGSNSFHMIIARIVNGSVQIISRLKQKVQLANGLDENNILSQKAIERGVSCLSRFAERLKGFPIENVNVVGTYTLRQAVNSDEFLEAAKKVFPYPISIISGEIEAKTIYSGVSHTQLEKGRKFVIDIGGGSTEMIIGDQFIPLEANSRNMGCVSFGLHYFPNGKISLQNFENAKEAALATIIDLVPRYKNLGWQQVWGTSGTIKTVYQAVMANIDSTGIIRSEYLSILKNKVLQVSHFKELKLAGLRSDRVDVFVPGLAILMALFEAFNITKAEYSDGALREGIIYSLDQKFQVENIRERTIKSLVQQFSIDLIYANKVSKTLNKLTQNYYSWHKSWQREEILEILQSAALLHEVGLVINYPYMHKHSAYILQNLDLPGFDKKSHSLLAFLVRFHQKSLKGIDLKNIKGYVEKDVWVALRLLRLAILLNKTRQKTLLPDGFSFVINKNISGSWHLTFPHGYLDEYPLLKQDLCEEAKLLQKVGFVLSFE